MPSPRGNSCPYCSGIIEPATQCLTYTITQELSPGHPVDLAGGTLSKVWYPGRRCHFLWAVWSQYECLAAAQKRRNIPNEFAYSLVGSKK